MVRYLRKGRPESRCRKSIRNNPWKGNEVFSSHGFLRKRPFNVHPLFDPGDGRNENRRGFCRAEVHPCP